MSPALRPSVREAMAAIYTSLMLFEWMKGQPAGVQGKVWARGPYGDDSLSLKARVGGFSGERLEWAATSTDRMIRALTRERSQLKISVGGKPGYDADSGVLTVKDSTADEVIDGLAAELGRSGAGLASFIRNRYIAAGDCLVSDSQLA
jgi:hypothetical protein